MFFNIIVCVVYSDYTGHDSSDTLLLSSETATFPAYWEPREPKETRSVKLVVDARKR